MRNLTVPICALVFLLISSPVWAGNETGLYIGGSIGSAGLDVKDGNVKYDDNDQAYKIFAGFNFGIIPLINLGVEGSYVDFGTAKGTVAGSNAKTSVTGEDLFGVAGVNLGPVTVFGKVGGIRWHGKSSVSSQSESDSGTDPAYGLGLQFNILSFGIRTEYELFTLNHVDIGMVSAGVLYTF
jgi:hypothetical protein